MLEILDSQQFGKSEELLWPSSDSHLHSLSSGPAVAEVEKSFEEFLLVEEETEGKETPYQRFDCFTEMEASTGEALSHALPEGWSVVTINLTEDQNTLFISRQQSNREPIVFAVSLNRQNKKEEDDDEEFSFQAAISELRDIIQNSDDTSRNAKNIDSREGRIEWWSTRKTLDKRLETLLKEIEYSWLGAFKVSLSAIAVYPTSLTSSHQTIFNPVDGTSPASLSAFKASLEKIFRNALSRQDKAKVNRVRLQTSVIECFSSLSSKSVEQEIEDLVYYLLDLYLYNGVPVALAELDIEQVSQASLWLSSGLTQSFQLIIDVQSALSTFENDRRNESISPRPEEHIFLILDRHVQEIPWESIPILRGRPISRIPSARFLLDRLVRPPSSSTVDTSDEDVGQRHLVDVANTCFILNAAGDLKQTQARFGDWLDDMTRSHGWKGIVNRHPSELEVGALLGKHDLIL